VSVTVRVVNETATTRQGFRWIYLYVHPLDECGNGGSSWEVTVQEFAPGLISFQHPCCSRCGGEPIVESFRRELDTD
jgi:hypothetical protein